MLKQIVTSIAMLFEVLRAEYF